MQARNPAEAASPNEEHILTTAVGRVAGLWRLTNEALGSIIGVSAPTASRLKSGSHILERGTKAFELGQHLVRLFRSLDALTGSDDEASVSWLRTWNVDLGGRPLDLIRTIRGMWEVANYVDDFRARV